MQRDIERKGYIIQSQERYREERAYCPITGEIQRVQGILSNHAYWFPIREQGTTLKELKKQEEAKIRERKR